MTVPEIDIDLLTVNMLPPEQRKPHWKIMATALNSPNDRLYDLLTSFMNGSIDLGYWISTITYSAGDLVRTINGVYESLTDGNTGHAVSDPAYWLKVLDSFIGATERSKYNGRYLTLTWALNRHFGTTFRQPPYPAPYGGSGTYSDIYLTTDNIVDTSFVMFPNSERSSKMFPTFSTGWLFDTPVYANASTYRYTVHVPEAVFDALGDTDEVRKSVIRGIVDIYNVSGINYSIETYT